MASLNITGPCLLSFGRVERAAQRSAPFGGAGDAMCDGVPFGE